MQKVYIVNGIKVWFEEGHQPKCAVEDKAIEVKEKKPTNKARKVASK